MKLNLWGTLQKLNPFQKPKVWFTSDLHFSHRNVIVYCNRPYKSIEEMNSSIIKTWNSQVSEKDTVYCLGDFSLSMGAMEEFTPRLKGKKILISGNHDHCFAWNHRNPKPTKLTRYLSAGWDEVHQKLKLTLKNGMTVLLSHLPYADEIAAQYDKRYLEYRPKNEGLVLLHGHQHCTYLKNKNRIDVGFDHNFQLYSEDDIIKLIEDKREFIPSRLTGIVSNKVD